MKRFLPSWRIVAVSIGAVAFGWGLAGWWTPTRRADPAHRESGPSKPPRIASWGSGSLDAEIAAVAAAGTADAQMAAAVELAARIDPKDFAAFLENLRRLPAHAAQGLASRTVLRRWVALDPTAALRWCTINDRDKVEGVLDEWARQLPPDRIVQILDLVPADQRAQAIPSVFNALAAHDPEAALDLLGEPGADQTMYRIDRALDRLAMQDSAWLLERAESLPEQVRRSLRGAAVQAMAESGSADVFDFVMSQPDRIALLTSLSEKSRHAPAVLAAVAGLPHTEQNNLYLPLHSLDRGEVSAVVDAIVAHRGQFSENLLNNLVSNLSYALTRSEDPGALANRLLASDAGQPFHISSFASNWARRSPEEARAWAASLPDESTRRAAIEAIDGVALPAPGASPPSLVEKLTEQAGSGRMHEPHRLLALTEEQRLHVLHATFDRALENQTKPGHHSGSWASQSLAQRYPAEAARWIAENLTAGNAAGLMEPLAATATHWAAENPQHAAAWAAALPAGESRAWAAANVVGQWRLYDESAARAWIETLPPDERTIASRALGSPSPKR